MKVGDYVRTEYGIDKVFGYRYEPEYENGHVVWFEKSNSGSRYIDKNLPKSSPNIIDLIEVGDYVNGHRVLDIAQTPIRALYLEDISQKGALIPVCDYQIKSIVTKEQFSAIEYKKESVIGE